MRIDLEGMLLTVWTEVTKARLSEHIYFRSKNREGVSTCLEQLC